jgi:hypothetical protein
MRIALSLVFLSLASAAMTHDEIDAFVAPMWATLRANRDHTGDLSTVAFTDDFSAVQMKQAIDGVKNTTECEIRMLAYEYALKELPERAVTKMLEVFDALELMHSCGVERPTPSALPSPAYPNPTGPGAFFVDPAKGTDTNQGTEADPFATVGAALKATRTMLNSKGATKAIVLRAGVHFLADTLKLDKQDSNLLITNYKGEEAWLSGGAKLKTEWKPFNVSGTHFEHILHEESHGESFNAEPTMGDQGAYATFDSFARPTPAPAPPNVYVTDVDPSISEMLGLMTLDPQERLTRARWPNALPEDRHTIKNLGGRDGLTGYLPPKKKPHADNTWINLTVPTTSSKGIEVDPYDGSILSNYNAFANGHCKKAGDPACFCGTWKDHRHGVWSSYSYHCAKNISGGWYVACCYY